MLWDLYLIFILKSLTSSADDNGSKTTHQTISHAGYNCVLTV